MEESSVPEVSTRSAGVRYGLILAGVAIVYFLALTFANVDTTEGIGRWGNIVFYIGAIYLAQKYFMENGDGFMSFGQGMSITFWAGLVCSAIYSAFFYVYLKFIDVSFVETIKQKQIEKMQEQGMSDEQIDQAMSIASNFMTPEVMLFFALVGGVIFIVIVGLIVTIFTQRRSPEASM